MTDVSPRGLVVPLVTPLGPGGPNEPDLARLLDWVTPHAAGVLLGDPVVGEGALLGIADRKEVLLSGINLARGRCTVLADVSSKSRRETEELAGWIGTKTGGGCILVDTALQSGGNRGLAMRCKRLTELSGLKLVVRNSPRIVRGVAKPFKRVNIRTAIVKALAENPDVLGVIHSGDARRARNYLRAVRRRPEFRIYDGDEGKFLTFPSTSGVVAATANVFPGEWARIVCSSLSPEEGPVGGLGVAQALVDWAGKLGELVELCQEAPALVIKKALVSMGIIRRDRTVLEEVPRSWQSAKLEELIESVMGGARRGEL